MLIDGEATGKKVLLTFNFTVSEASSKWRQNATQLSGLARPPFGATQGIYRLS
jgi:hypothetical protein